MKREYILKTISVQQRSMQCGPASLKIVAAYFGITKTEKELSKLCKTSKHTGTTGRNLLKAAQAIGLVGGIVDNASFRTIESWLKKEVPVIVNWFSPGQSRPVEKNRMAGGHFSVAVGLTKTYIILEDPGVAQRRQIPRDDFMRVWFDYEGKRQPSKSSDIYLRRLIVLQPE